MNAEYAQVVRQFERLTGEPLDETTPGGIQRLVDESVPEGEQLDYKVDAYDGTAGKTDKKDELRKDVSALANARGGVIVLGVADNQGTPGKVVGLIGSLEQIQGRIHHVLASGVEPYLDVRTVPVDGSASEPSCLLIVVPRSSRRPHAMRPTTEPDALKFARRGGAHTAWLSESQVADAYRDRFAIARNQTDRLHTVADAARAWLTKRDWLLLTLAPEIEGEMTVNREAPALVQGWLTSHEQVNLIPNRPALSVSSPEIGARQVVVAGRDATSVPIGSFLALHSDGSVAIAFELEGPGGNPSIYLDRLVGDVIEGLDLAVGLSADLSGAGGNAAVRVEMLTEISSTVICWDASWSDSPVQLPRAAASMDAVATIDIDAARTSPSDLIAAAAMLAARAANHFGEADGKYLADDGRVRINQFQPNSRDKLVIPRASELGLATSDEL